MTDLIFCTLFDSNYLDKGLVLYDSMCENMSDFKLYVVAFDDIAYEILENESDGRLIPIRLSEFETDELKKVKKERTKAEYCWTCSSWSIKYVLERYHEPICTYIDADMMFFSSPQAVFNRMYEKKCSVIIVPHRFDTEKERIKAHDTVGEYCVEFNTFVNNEDGKKVLDWWAERCLEWCYYAVPGTTEWYGDQKYLNAFPEKFDGVYICEHYGVGLAPWNVQQVELLKNSRRKNTDKILLGVRSIGKRYPLILYHFESVSFLTDKLIYTPSKIRSKKLYERIYVDYIEKIIKKRAYLEEKYHLRLERKRRVVTKNPILKFYQKYLAPFRRIRKRTDVYILRKK